MVYDALVVMTDRAAKDTTWSFVWDEKNNRYCMPDELEEFEPHWITRIFRYSKNHAEIISGIFLVVIMFGLTAGLIYYVQTH